MQSLGFHKDWPRFGQPDRTETVGPSKWAFDGLGPDSVFRVDEWAGAKRLPRGERSSLSLSLFFYRHNTSLPFLSTFSLTHAPFSCTRNFSCGWNFFHAWVLAMMEDMILAWVLLPPRRDDDVWPPYLFFFLLPRPIFLSLSPCFNLSLSHCCSQSLADGGHEDGDGLCAAELGASSQTNRRALAVAGGILVIQELLLSPNSDVVAQAALLIKFLFSNCTIQEYISNELIRSLTG